MDFRISGNRYVEVSDTLQTGNQVGSVREAVRVRHIAGLSLRRITAQRDEVPDPLVPVLSRDVQNLAATRANARQMRRSDQRSLPLDTRDNVVSALTSRAVRPVCNGDEARRERRKP